MAGLQTQTHQRHVHQKVSEDSGSWKQATPQPPPTTTNSKRDHQFTSQFMLGLTIAGVASCLLVTTFGLFHVDFFLRVYQLPLDTYSFGNLVFAIVNTANDFLGAWFLDSVASNKIRRSDMIGISGCIFCLAFLTPFFRWKEPSALDGLHFILSLSMYDTMYSFTCILLGSLVTDNHHMNDDERVWFMASGKIANLVAAFAVARLGLMVFDADNMKQFRAFLWVLAVLAAAMFVVAQIMMRYSVDRKSFPVFRYLKQPNELQTKKKTRQLELRQVMHDFWHHKNFWAWVGMELFLESQVSFANAFLKTFVDRLVYDEGVSRENCDWLLSVIRPLGLIAGILCYIPIRRFGYRRVYPILFAVNAALCLVMLLAASHKSTNMIIAFLVIYPTLTVAVSSSGFHLVMSDMVLEMKKIHAKDGRLDEPSLAGLFMGMNALFYKPAESILPVVAANMLSHVDFNVEGHEGVQIALFKLLIFPPLVFSILEWASWRRYTLTPQKTSQMREELHSLHT
jgi:Na+/melibiose symporter-like transporter